MIKSAIISEDGLYRYELRREWNDSLPPFVIGMLNPSKADHQVDDPTINRVMSRALHLGYGSIIVWNLGAGRATKPTAWMTMDDPVGTDNYTHIERILRECKQRRGLAVVGWGTLGGFMGLDSRARVLARDLDLTLWCFARTKHRHPSHPLYIPASKGLEPYLYDTTLTARVA